MTREELAASIAKGFRGIVEKLEEIDANLKSFGDGVVLYQRDVEGRIDGVNAKLRTAREDIEKLKKAVEPQ